jgi:hypothetical protein
MLASKLRMMMSGSTSIEVSLVGDLKEVETPKPTRNAIANLKSAAKNRYGSRENEQSEDFRSWTREQRPGYNGLESYSKMRDTLIGGV